MPHKSTMRTDLNKAIKKHTKKKPKRGERAKKHSASNVGGASVGGGT